MLRWKVAFKATAGGLVCGSTCGIRLEAVCASEEGNPGSPKPLVERASVGGR